ncbi:hypothetical protein HL653_22775 [Sphingomonas sp. AP4-R1]|uniref:hypothetical protein n=1 Tax=Sphingomonas sp. AP4-R1 TaxID=2735134 RepID=UPI0014938E29|nr:hypothetical protein [Sphingomonas sp. AP4-R1]QJU60185.1 hypothetical protein HL653_22775 [Sphingomonas sp. AP4-R1]
MTDADRSGRPLPAPVTESCEAPPAYVAPASRPPIARPSSGAVFGRGLLLIVAEMVQLVLALILVVFALACCLALAVKANDAYHFLGENFVTPRAVLTTFGSMLAWTPTFLIICVLASIFGIKLLDLIVRVLGRRARLAEIYSA